MGNIMMKRTGDESKNGSNEVIKKTPSDDELEKMVEDITKKNIKLCLYKKNYSMTSKNNMLSNIYYTNE
jgi:hypothetical protein